MIKLKFWMLCVRGTRIEMLLILRFLYLNLKLNRFKRRLRRTTHILKLVTSSPHVICQRFEKY